MPFPTQKKKRGCTLRALDVHACKDVNDIENKKRRKLSIEFVGYSLLEVGIERED